MVEKAVKGMLPHNSLGRAQLKSSRSTPGPTIRTAPSSPNPTN